MDWGSVELGDTDAVIQLEAPIEPHTRGDYSLVKHPFRILLVGSERVKEKLNGILHGVSFVPMVLSPGVEVEKGVTIFIREIALDSLQFQVIAKI